MSNEEKFEKMLREMAERAQKQREEQLKEAISNCRTTLDQRNEICQKMVDAMPEPLTGMDISLIVMQVLMAYFGGSQEHVKMQLDSTRYVAEHVKMMVEQGGAPPGTPTH